MKTENLIRNLTCFFSKYQRQNSHKQKYLWPRHLDFSNPTVACLTSHTKFIPSWKAIKTIFFAINSNFVMMFAIFMIATRSIYFPKINFDMLSCAQFGDYCKLKRGEGLIKVDYCDCGNLQQRLWF